VPDSLIDFTADTTRAVAQLHYGNTFARTPNVKYIFSHAGGTIPYLATRFSIIDEMNVIPGAEERGTAADTLRRLYWDTALSWRPPVQMIRAAGLPLPPLALALSVVVELGGGLLLVAGFRTRIAAAALALFSLATAVSFHSNFADQNQMIHFLKNVMIAGGMLQIVGFGAGALSVDNRSAKGAQEVS
jgi:putative oxidoreductase